MVLATKIHANISQCLKACYTLGAELKVLKFEVQYTFNNELEKFIFLLFMCLFFFFYIVDRDSWSETLLLTPCVKVTKEAVKTK